MSSNFTLVDGVLSVYTCWRRWWRESPSASTSQGEHFLVAGREMNLYLGIASLAATEFGIVTCMYAAEAGYTRGFSGAVPGICNAIAMWVVGYTGFCVKPLRDSGVITIPSCSRAVSARRSAGPPVS